MITETQQGRSKRFELYEIIEAISSETKPAKKVELIRHYLTTYTSFADYVRCVFDEKYSFFSPIVDPHLPQRLKRMYPRVGTSRT
mgnify:CR=1 FL=1